MLKLKPMQKASISVRQIKDIDIPQVVEIDLEAFLGESSSRSYKSYQWEIKNPLAHYIVACTERDFLAQTYAQEKQYPELNQQDKPKMLWFNRLFKLNRGTAHTIVSRGPDSKLKLKGKALTEAERQQRGNEREEETREAQEEYIVGFVGSWIMAREAHIISIAVRNNCRGRGIGEKLLISAIDLAIRLNASLVTLEVRASNQIAQALYGKYGFQVTGKRRGYYTDNGEDAIVMSADTITSARFQTRFEELRQAHAKR